MALNATPIRFTRNDLKDLGRLTTVYIKKETSLDGCENFTVHFADGARLQEKLSLEEANRLINQHNLKRATIH